MLSVARLFPAASSAGVTALTLLLTPLTLQIANKFIPRARGNPKDGSPASDLELAGLNANGGAQARACQLTRVGVRCWSVAGWVGWSQRLAFAGPFGPWVSELLCMRRRCSILGACCQCTRCMAVYGGSSCQQGPEATELHPSRSIGSHTLSRCFFCR